MKNKASLILMEQLVMILVFALAAAACLQAFVWADSMSRQIQQKDRAAVLCQNAAETVKATGSTQLAAAIPAQEGLKLWVQETDSGIPGLGMARIWVTDESTQQELFCITTGWQEVLP